MCASMFVSIYMYMNEYEQYSWYECIKLMFMNEYLLITVQACKFEAIHYASVPSWHEICSTHLMLISLIILEGAGTRLMLGSFFMKFVVLSS